MTNKNTTTFYSVAETRTIEVGTRQKPPRTDGEILLDDLPPIEELHITVPETDCMEVGKVSAIVNQMGKFTCSI